MARCSMLKEIYTFSPSSFCGFSIESSLHEAKKNGQHPKSNNLFSLMMVEI
jgi:hypothetical protein